VSCLELAFVNIGAYGNHIWIDNVTLNTAYSIVENDDAARADLMIHPNPSGGQCQVIVPSLWLGKHYGVYDAAGRLVAESTFKRTHEQWAMDLPAGIFTIQIEGQRAVRWVIR